VLTGAGASVPLGMPAMDGFERILSENQRQLLKQIRPPNTTTAWNDLEELLERLTFYEDIDVRHRRDPNLQIWIRFISGRDTGNIARQLKNGIFQGIIERLGLLDEQAAEIAESLYKPLFLDLLGSATNDSAALPIFTTNYDLTFEAIRDRSLDFTICNGIRGMGESFRWSQKAYEETRDYKFAIFRLHGCSHWMKQRSTGRIFFQPLPDTRNPETREPCVLYPLPFKETRIYEQPFRCAYFHFEQALVSAQTIVIIGYSGRDPAIQFRILEALEHDRTKRIAVVTGNDEVRPEFDEIKTQCAEFKHFVGGIEKTGDKLTNWVGGVP